VTACPNFDRALLLDDEQDRLNVLDEVYRVYVEFGPVNVKASEISDRLDLDRLAMEKALHWLEGHRYIEWSSTEGELSITALGIDAIEKARQESQNKTVALAKPFGQSIGSMEMKADLRKHIIALLELGIEYNEHAGLTQTRLSELEHRLGLSHNTMREAIKYLGERGLAKLIVEDPRLPYGVSQAFVTDTGKLYYHQLLESKEKVKRTAPIEIQESLRVLKEDHSDSSKVGFIMMKFKETPAHEEILRTIKDTLTNCGLVGVRSDDHEYHKDLFYNIQTYMHGCGFGVAIFDRIEEEAFSPNVSLEVGYMMALGKDVCLLKDKTLETLHADLLGKLYKPFDPQNAEGTIPNQLSKWLSDKGLGQPSRVRGRSVESHELSILMCSVSEDDEYAVTLERKLFVEGHASVGRFSLSSLVENDPQGYGISYFSVYVHLDDLALFLVSKLFLKQWAKQGLETLSTSAKYKDFFESFIPIWLDVTVQDLASYSPYLANRYLADRERSIAADLGIDEVFNRIARLLQDRSKADSRPAT
jgi:DNA-binding transcriptional ArsR family regulator